MDYIDRSFKIMVMIVDLKKFLVDDLGFKKSPFTLSKEYPDRTITHVKFGENKIEVYSNKAFHNKEYINYSLLFDMVMEGTPELANEFIQNAINKINS